MDTALHNAIMALNLNTIQTMRLDMDAPAMNRYLDALTTALIQSLVSQSKQDQRLNFLDTVENTKKYYSALLKVTNMNLRLDLSPWRVIAQVFNEMMRIPEGRSNAELYAADIEAANNQKRPFVFSVCVVLTALSDIGLRPILNAHSRGLLPHHRIQQSQNAFVEVRNFETPLMFAIKNSFDTEIVQVLFARGGFSTEEWQYGLVMSLLCTKYNIGALAKQMMEFYGSEVRFMINQPLDDDGTPLHHLCSSKMNLGHLLNDLRVFIEILHADPGIKAKSTGLTASETLEANIYFGSHPTIAAIISESSKYLKDHER
jgi:hypothetical protein